jgi:CheY-like chemotaxis protein
MGIDRQYPSRSQVPGHEVPVRTLAAGPRHGAAASGTPRAKDLGQFDRYLDAMPGCRQVMVVDDNADAREMISMVLRFAGYEPICAVNGEDALNQARAHQPCLILLDIMMPVLDGLGFRRLQLSDPSLAAIPVVCLSAIASEAMQAELSAECLMKPVDMDQLVAIVRDHCPPPPAPPL